MDLSHKQFTKKIVEIIKNHIKADHFIVFYFGSRTNGNATERSDIDIGIDVKEKLPPGTLLDIKEDLDKLRTLMKFDVVNFNDASDDFKRIAMKNIEVIYER